MATRCADDKIVFTLLWELGLDRDVRLGRGGEVKVLKIIEHVSFLLGTGTTDGAGRCSAEQMDEQRHEKIAYEYLCHLQTLTDALSEKKQLAAERSLNSSYTPDVYDELLTGEEIQTQIDCVNEFSALEKVALAVEQSDPSLMLSALLNPVLSVGRLRSELAKSYFQALASIVASKGIERCDLQAIIDQVNSDHDSFRERDQHVKAINKSLTSANRDAGRTLALLHQLFDRAGSSDEASSVAILDMAAPLYHEEMANFRQMTEEDLNFQMICGAVRTLTRVAQVTHAVDSHNVADLLFVLEDPLLSFEGFNSSMTTDYLVALGDMRREKMKAREFCPVLTHIEIQQCITQVNENTNREDTALLIHRAVDEGNVDQLVNLLVDANFVDDSDDNTQPLGPLYMRMLRTLIQAKMRRTDQNQFLSLGDVEEVVEKAREFVEESRQALSVACAINNLRDAAAFIEGLDTGYLRIPEMSRTQFQTCMKRLEARTQGVRIDQLPPASAWISHRLTQGIPVFLNVQNRTVRWEKPATCDPSPKLIGIQEFEELVTSIVHKDEVERLEQAIEPVVTRLQAFARGFLVREHLAQRLSHFHNNVGAMVRIQSWWRQVVQRQRFLRELRRRRDQERSRDLNFYRRYLKHIIRIQAWCRRWLAMRSYRAIKRGDMPLSTLRRFLHLLDIGQRDYDEEMQVQLLKNDVMQTIRRNKQLEKDLNSMDIKIGLLVKNQIALQDVVAHGHKLRKHVSKAPEHNKENHAMGKSGSESHAHSRPGIELLSLTQKGRHKLESYQHLFYLLQTEPRYLAKLLFLQPQKFPETMVLALYNYGSNLREEYLLLKLFRCALEEEVRHKVDSLNDAATGNTLVVKLIIQLSRQGHRVSQLREMLGPIVERILKENVFINLSPVEIYKLWINQLESASGQPCGMPYEVNADEALKHTEVQRRLKNSIDFLKNATSLFLNEITSSIRNIPYGMLYVAKVLARALRHKFPQVMEKDVLKVIGNLIYYRYINPTIVSPDAFDIISVSPTQVLTTDQRRNLGNVAKMLQFAASKKGFAEESPHLMCLNPFIVECHERFKTFFRECIQVEEPEVEFGMDQYSEATLITKPTVCVSLQEMANIHQCLVEYESVLAPEPEDPLHEILDDFGPGELRNRPSIQFLLAGDSKENVGTFNDLNEVAKTEIFLTLNNKFEAVVVQTGTGSVNDEKSQKLFVATKQMLISILRCCQGDNLKEIIIRPATVEEQALYTSFCLKQQRLVERNVPHTASQTVSNTDTTEPMLNTLKMRVSRNLRSLEKANLVSGSDNYAALVTALARDVVTLRTHRRARSQELDRLMATKRLLDEKTRFYEEQVESYHQYLETCLKNLTLGKNQKRILQHRQEGNHLQLANALKSRTTLHYSATKLHQKGILIDIEGLPQAHFKSTFFDICPAAETGVFDVTAKFLGVSVEKIQLNIQDLLQMQFEGVSVLNIFKKAKVNVNLLIFLLNSKFYGKTLKK